MTDIAVKLTDPAKNRYGFCMRGAAGGQALFMDMLHGFGLEPVVDGKAALDRAGLIEAMDWYTGLYTELKVCQPSAPERWLPADHGVLQDRPDGHDLAPHRARSPRSSRRSSPTSS